MGDSQRRWPRWRPWRSGGADRDAGDETDTGEPSSGTARETVLVTGCDTAVGRATAERFLAAGWRVHAAAPDPAALAPLADAGCETAELDVTADANVAGVVRRVHSGTDRLDCLVTVPRPGRLGPVEDLPTDGLDAELDATVLGPHRLARRVLPHMRERGSGTVVAVASALGRVGVPGATGVCAPAAALASATAALRGEVAPFGVDVVLVETGPVRGADARRATSGRRQTRPGGKTAEGRAADGTARADGAGGDARTEAYASLWDALDDARLVGPAVGSVAPERVAETVLNAASCTDPAPRYGVGRAAQVARLAAAVPPRWRDRAFGLVRRLP